MRDDLSESSVPFSPVDSVLIVGAGLAGLRTVHALRAQGFTGEITVIGAETHPPYDRPPLSKHLLDHSAPRWLSDDLGADIYSLADQVWLGYQAVALTAVGSRWQVSLATRHLGNDSDIPTEEPDTPRIVVAGAVVIATGSLPVAPVALKQAHTLHTWDDAVSLRTQLESFAADPLRDRAVSDLVLIGAGWIGMELASVARSLDLTVTLLEGATAPLARHLGPIVGARCGQWAVEAGVDLRTQSLVREVSSTNRDLLWVGIETPNSAPAAVAARSVVNAIGARPSTAWLPDFVTRGENGALRTTEDTRVITRLERHDAHPPLFAVGDCAQRDDPFFGTISGGHWDVALNDPERTAAAIMGSSSVARSAAPHVFSTQFGREINLFGIPDPATSQVVFRELTADSWIAFYIHDTEQSTADAEQSTADPSHAPVTVAAAFAVNALRESSQLRKRLAHGAFTTTRTALEDPNQPIKLL